VTGTFAVGLYKPDNTAQIHNLTYSINSANTWEYKTLTFAANTTAGGVIDNNNAVGFYVNWHIAAGSSYKGGGATSGWSAYAQNKWADGLGTDAIMTTTNATFFLTGCQLEVGPQSTPFEHESAGVTLNKCLRYYFDSKTTSSAPYDYATQYIPSHRFYKHWYNVPMRANPTVTTTNSGGAPTHYHPNEYHWKGYVANPSNTTISTRLLSFTADAEL